MKGTTWLAGYDLCPNCVVYHDEGVVSCQNHTNLTHGLWWFWLRFAMRLGLAVALCVSLAMVNVVVWRWAVDG